MRCQNCTKPAGCFPNCEKPAPAITTGGTPKYIRLSDAEIQIFDKALLASTEFLYELKV